MNIFKKLPDLFLKDYLEQIPDVFEKARIRISFNLLVIGIIFLVPLEITLIFSALYFSLAISILIQSGLLAGLYFIRVRKDYRTGTRIATIFIFSGLSADLLFSDTVALVDILWFALLILYSFFTLGERWGYAVMFCLILVNLVYVRYFFYDNFHNEEIYEAGQLIAMAVTLLFGYLMIYFFVKAVSDAQKEAEIKLKEHLAALNDMNRQLEKVNQELNSSNKSLESFTYSVSHDLRAPLRSITGYTDLLARDYRDKLPAEARNLLDSVKGSAEKMMVLINDLLTFARSGSKDLKLEMIDMNALLGSVISDFEKNEGAIKARVTIHPLPPSEGDAPLIRQVLYNLLSNAVKYSSVKENPQIEVGSMRKENENIYFIKDNGVGFDMTYAAKLFKIFQRLHSEAEFKGTGIGLAIVKQIIDRHGGRVWAESKPDEGATFYFSLPAIPAEVPGTNEK